LSRVGFNAALPAGSGRLIISGVVRRIHVPRLAVGDIPLAPAQAHHARDVLRLAEGSAVEVFDDGGAVADATLFFHEPDEAFVRVERVLERSAPVLRIVVAAAVPKGDRADWMIEKLSELGTDAFIPLATAHSVVLPEGKGKHERWVRIATESAKQSRRRGVMRIEPLTPVERVMKATRVGWFLRGDDDAAPVRRAVLDLPAEGELTLLIGPEGGWTDAEIAIAKTCGLMPVRLTPTVLRVETAAIAAAGFVAAFALEP